MSKKRKQARKARRTARRREPSAAIAATLFAFGLMFMVVTTPPTAEDKAARTASWQRFVEAHKKPAPTVRQMAQSIPVAKEPPTDPGADPVVLIPKEGPNPEIRKLSEAEKAANLTALGELTPGCDVHDWLCVSHASGLYQYDAKGKPVKDRPYGARN